MFLNFLGFLFSKSSFIIVFLIVIFSGFIYIFSLKNKITHLQLYNEKLQTELKHCNYKLDQIVLQQNELAKEYELQFKNSVKKIEKKIGQYKQKIDYYESLLKQYENNNAQVNEQNECEEIKNILKEVK